MVLNQYTRPKWLNYININSLREVCRAPFCTSRLEGGKEEAKLVLKAMDADGYYVKKQP